MIFFDFLVKTKSNKSKDFITPSFSSSVEKAILFIDSSEKNLNEDTLFKKLCEICNNNFEAHEISIFLPIAFIRLLLPKVNWNDTYNEIDSNKKETKRSFQKTESYQIIFQISEKHFQKISQATIIKIAGRSAEFHAMNKLLLDNQNAKPEDIKPTETTIIR